MTFGDSPGLRMTLGLARPAFGNTAMLGFTWTLVPSGAGAAAAGLGAAFFSTTLMSIDAVIAGS